MAAKEEKVWLIKEPLSVDVPERKQVEFGAQNVKDFVLKAFAEKAQPDCMKCSKANFASHRDVYDFRFRYKVSCTASACKKANLDRSGRPLHNESEMMRLDFAREAAELARVEKAKQERHEAMLKLQREADEAMRAKKAAEAAAAAKELEDFASEISESDQALTEAYRATLPPDAPKNISAAAW